MDTKQISDALDRLFNEEEARIVFWNDPDKSFRMCCHLCCSKASRHSGWITWVHWKRKSDLSKDDPTGKYLLYAATEEPDYENDWSLDIRLYSRSFLADKASILLDQLGLLNHHLRQHLADRRKFLDAEDRVHKLKPLVAADDTAAGLDRKILAVVVKADQPEFFNIVRTLFHAWTESDDELDLDSPPAVWEQIEKNDLAQSFWEMAKTHFGYGEESSAA